MTVSTRRLAKSVISGRNTRRNLYVCKLLIIVYLNHNSALKFTKIFDIITSEL